MSSPPPIKPPARTPVPLSVKVNRIRGAAGVPYRTAKLKRVLKINPR